MNREQVLANTILLVRHGSHAYGLATETSDVDIKGVCIPPFSNYVGLDKPFETYVESRHEGHPNDLVIHGLQKFARLACGGNPTILEVLFVDESEVSECTHAGRRLRENKELFLARNAFNAFYGYATQQLALVEKAENSVANNNAETRAKSWKNLSHTIRLLRMCNELMQTGHLFVKRDDRARLLAIKRGEIPLGEVIKEAEILMRLGKMSRERAPLPNQPNHSKINALLIDITREHLYL